MRLRTGPAAAGACCDGGVPGTVLATDMPVRGEGGEVLVAGRRATTGLSSRAPA